MPTVLGHVVAATALGTVFAGERWPRRAYFVGALCAMLPDLDVIGLRLGIPYGSPLGHRGLSHSLAGAALLAGLALLTCFERKDWRWPVALYLFLATVSHGVLDAFTSGGLGVGFFEPFEHSRTFFPWRPIRVSPLALSRILSPRFWAVLGSEVKWIVAPATLLGLLALLTRKGLTASRDERRP